MTLRVETRVEDGLGTIAKGIIATTKDDWFMLQQIMQRATNLWPDAPPQVKRIADIVTNGHVMQDYGHDKENSDDTQIS